MVRAIDASGAEVVRQFLLGMIDHDDPDKVLEAILRADGKMVKA